MALVTISGYPCSGKSTRANQLKGAFEEKLADPSYTGQIEKVVIVSDDLLSLTRQAYDGKSSLSAYSPLHRLNIAYAQMGRKRSHSALPFSRQCNAPLQTTQS